MKQRKLLRTIIQLLSFTTIIFISITNSWASNFNKSSDAKNQILIDQNSKRLIHAVHVNDEIKIDGRIDEPAWEAVTFQGDFRQREPNEAKPATERTEIGVLYDQRNLYFGIKCFDSKPDKIIAREMRRDAIVDDDDYFEMVIDTYHDKRSGYYFITNAHGSKRNSRSSTKGLNLILPL